MISLEEKFSRIFLKSWRPFFWIAFAILFVYSATFFYSIVYLDDNVLVTGQYQFNKELTNIPQAFQEDIFRTPQNGGTFYRPIERITFILDAQFGEWPLIFMSHLSNVVLHITAMLLLFLLLLKMSVRRGVAFLLILIFSIHPLTAQTVAFISGRNDSLLAIFIFPALIFFIDFLQKQRREYLFLHFFFFSLALLTKETAVILPVLCAGYLLLCTDWKKILEHSATYLTILFGWIGITGIWFLIRLSVLHNFIGNADYNIFLSIYKNLPSLIPAIGKIFLPFDLSVFPIMKDMSLSYGLLSLSMLAIWFIFSEKKNLKLISFGILWFVIFIFLTLVKPNDTIPEFSENRIYIPMFGCIFVILGLGTIRLPKVFKEKIQYEINKKKIAAGIGLLLILILSSVTLYRNHYYKNQFNFWRNATETSPNFAFNHNNLGAIEYLQGNLNVAEEEFKKALALNANEEMAHNNLGLIYATREKFSEAEEEYKKELEINPNYDNAYYNLGLSYWGQKKYIEAVDSWEKAVLINPNNTEALRALVFYYYDQKNYAKLVPYAYELYIRGFELPPELLQILQYYTVR